MTIYFETYTGDNTSEIIIGGYLLSENPPVAIYYDYIDGRGGNDTIYAGDFDDILYGGTGNDTIFAGGDPDSIYGGEGDDNLNGEEGNDSFSGANGNDAISGGSGNDSISGDFGADYLHGGSGRDTFGYFSAVDSLVGLGRDNIADFTPGVDKIDLRLVDANASLAGNQAFSTAQIVYIGGMATIDILGSTQDMQIFLSGNPAVNWTDIYL